MACTLYIKYHDHDIRVGRFKDREAAERHYSKWKDTLYSKGNSYPMPIYVDSRKGSSKG